jgi:hypothetical protein
MVHCFTGCEPGAVVAALGLGLADLFDEPKSSRRGGAVARPGPRPALASKATPAAAGQGVKRTPVGQWPKVAEYVYVSAEGEVLYRVDRHQAPEGGRKTFRAFTPRRAGGWIARGPGDEGRVLYRLPEVLAAAARGDQVFLVEGEKDADTGAGLGVVATTAAFGASSKWLPQYTEALVGARVTVVADRDAKGTGYKRAAAVCEALTARGIAVEVVEAVEGKDLTDHVQSGHQLSELVVIDPQERLAACGQPAPVESRRVDVAVSEGEGARLYELPGARPGMASGRTWVEVDGRLCEVKRKDDRPVIIPFIGCSVRLSGQYTAVTGVEHTDQAASARVSRVELIARHPDSGEELVMHLTGPEWRSGDWLDALWPDVDYPTRRPERQDAVRAVRQVSREVKRCVEHTATGWRRDLGDGTGPAFIHAGGALTAVGNLAAVTRLPDVLGRYALPDPASTVEEVKTAAAASIGLMDLDWLPQRIAVVMAGAAYRAVLGTPAMVPNFVSPPGLGKTALAVIAAQHFAPTLSRHATGVSMADELGATVKSAAKMLAYAADVILIADDFAPDKGVRAAAEKQGAFIRFAYGRYGRTKLTREGEFVPGDAPRGLLMTSGEMMPSAESARERMLRVSLPWEAVPRVQIAAAQTLSEATERARFMATLIQWVARSGLDETTEWVNAYQAYAADRLEAKGYNARQAEHCSNLAAGWAAACEVMVSTGAWTREEATAYMEDRVWPALVEAAAADRDADEDSDVAARIVRLLSEALAAGQAHITDTSGECPASVFGVDLTAAGCGWRTVSGMSPTPSGPRVGVLREDRLLLFPGDVLAVVARRADEEGIPLNLTVAGASEMLDLAGMLRTTTENGARRRRVRARLGGALIRAWDIAADQVFGPDEEEPPPAPPPTLPINPDPRPTLTVVPPEPAQTETGGDAAPEDQAPARDEDSSSEAIVKMPAWAPCADCGELASHAVNGIPLHLGCEPPPPTPKPQTKPRGDAAKAEPRFVADTAVLDLDGAHLPDGTVVPLPDSPAHVGDLAVYAADVLRLGFGGGRERPLPGRLWLTPEYARSIGLPGTAKTDKAMRAALKRARGQAFYQEAWAQGWETKSKDDSDWIMLWRGRQSVILTSLGWAGAKTSVIASDDPSPRALARRMGLYASLIGRPWTITPAVTGIELLEAVHGPLSPVTLPEVPWGPMAADFAWRRTMTEQEKGRAFVHVYDRNASYLAATGGAILGEGELRRVDHPAVDPKQAGVWHVTSHCFPPEALVPSPFAAGGEDSDGWVTTPTLGLLAQFGPVEVDQAWLYDTPVRAMTGWYERMKRAVDQVKTWEPSPDHKAVEKAVKLTYTATVGRLAHVPEVGADRLAAHRRYRPDWRAMVVTLHRANATRAMLHAGGAGSWPVVMGHSDAVAFVSDEPDPIKAWPGRPQDLHPTQFGKYKPSKSDRVNAWLARVTPEMSPATMLDQVDAATEATDG